MEDSRVTGSPSADSSAVVERRQAAVSCSQRGASGRRLALAFLRELHGSLGLRVAPATDEVDGDATPFIQWGFDVYVNPRELMEEYLELGALNFSAIAELILRKK